MSQPRSYVVRVYRHGFRMLSGTVEDADTGNRQSFRDMQELANLLRGPISGHESSGRSSNSGPTNPEEQ